MLDELQDYRDCDLIIVLNEIDDLIDEMGIGHEQ